MIELLSETVLLCVGRHITLLNRRIAILEQMIASLEGDADLETLLASHSLRRAMLYTYSFDVITECQEMARKFGVYPWEVKVIMPRDEWLDIGPTPALVK